MREILFRGKRVDNGEWIYGQLWVNRTGTRETAHIFLDDGDMEEVEPSTVGQYTGLNDKNGVKIFEGDTIHSGEVICNVVYKDGAFMIRRTNGGGEYKIIIACQAKFEIIGNIHDIPELMVTRE